MHVYHSRWHELTPDHVENLFKAHLPGLSALPYNVLPDLRSLQIGTLEVVENRSESTLYMIRETGKYYYSPKKVNDHLKTSYKFKPPPFIISRSGNFHFIERIKSPRFKSKYDPVTKELFDIEWLDNKPSQTSLISTLKKAKGFLKERVK